MLTRSTFFVFLGLVIAITCKIPKLYPILDLPVTSNEAYASNYCTRDMNRHSINYFRTICMQIHRTRMHQLTLNAKKRDFVVLICEETPEAQRETFRRLGAIVIVEKNLWITKEAATAQFVDGHTKFHLYRLLQYERIVFLDADLYLQDSVVNIWHEPASQLRNVTNHPLGITSYVFAAVSDWCIRLPFPCGFDWMDENYFNAGMYLFSPSMEILNYITQEFEKLEKPLVFQDQDMLNLIYNRTGGFLPWTDLDTKYNVRLDQEINIEDAAILHGKFWAIEGFLTAKRWSDDWRQIRSYRSL